MTKRHFLLAFQILLNTRPDMDLLRYIVNKIKYFCRSKYTNTTVVYPSTIMLELGNHCNLHCMTCARENEDGKRMDKGFMKVVQAKKIIDELYPYLDTIGLTGMGETFFYEELKEVASYIKKKKKSIRISVSTNANFPNFIDKVELAIPYIDTIQVSMDGIGDTYEAIRCGGKFAPFEENLEKLISITKQHHVNLMLNLVITHLNYHQMPDVVEFAANRGIPFLNFTYYNLACSPYDVSYYDMFRTSPFVDVLAKTKEEVKKHKKLEVTGLDFPGAASFQKCMFPWGHYNITWDGYVVPCCVKPFPKVLNFGNVFENGVMSVLNSESYQQFRKMWQNNTKPEFCNKCHFVDL